MNTAITAAKASEIIEAVIAKGDIAQLSPQERAKYYVRVCESIGLNPMTRPFEYIVLNGKLTLYARKDATDQLRSIYGVSITDLAERERDGVFTIVATVTDKHGRTDMATGAVNIKSLQGENLANAMMKAETKAKRRATLSICGLGFLDESELPPAAASSVPPSPPQPRPRLADQLDALAPPNQEPEKRPRRGRPKKTDDDLDDAEIEQSQQRLAAVLGERPCNHTWGGTNKDGEAICIKCGELAPLTGDEPELQVEFDEGGPSDTWPGPKHPDYEQGKRDAVAGRAGCLNRDIREDAARLYEWQKGFDSIMTKRKGK